MKAADPQTFVGFAKVDITAWEPEMAMMGWGRMDNRIAGVHEPLHARAMAVGVGDRLVVYCCIELMAVSLAIRTAVFDRLRRDHGELGLDAHRVMLTATHTHSGPSGYSHYFFLNLNGPGFSPPVLEAAVSGAVAAIVAAVRGRVPAVLAVATGEMPLGEPVVFNRSWFAYNLNEDVEPVTAERRDEAVDRTMTVLEARASDGTPLGCVSWFSVHCTSVHSENDRLHSDNKGIAASTMEAFRPGYVAIHAQEAAGDATPNYRFHRGRHKVVGRFDDDYASAEYNGNQQARFATTLARRASDIVVPAVDGMAVHVDFSDIEASAKYAGRAGARTTGGVLGLSMAEGTAEGPGPLLGARALNRALTRRSARRREDPKVPMLEVGRGLDGRFLGMFSLRAMKIPALEDTIRYVKRIVGRGEMKGQPWIPQILPLQLLRIGPVLIVGVPFELTTVAGRRLRAALRPLFDVEHVIANSYANGYAGYCTTFEEYQLQHYEAGYTLFGPHQLAALLTKLEWMAQRWGDEVPAGPELVAFDDADLDARLFDTPWTLPRRL